MGSPAESGGAAAWEALGTGIALHVSDVGALASARRCVERELAAIDVACSRFRSDSELSRLNASRGRATVVGPLLCQALEVALRGAELSDGAVDPTVGRALELAGYDRDWHLLAPAPPLGAAAREPARPHAVLARVQANWRALELDSVRGVARLPAGMHVDLGATAKAWAADRAAAAAAREAGCGVLVGIGGDIATAGEAPAGGWRIHVTDDHRETSSATGQTIVIASGAIATSSTAVRRWTHAGRAMHHVIDPASGAPVRDTWRTVSVAAATCTDANVAATTALVRPAGAPRWLAERALPARLVDRDGRVTAIAGWPSEERAARAMA